MKEYMLVDSEGNDFFSVYTYEVAVWYNKVYGYTIREIEKV